MPNATLSLFAEVLSGVMRTLENFSPRSISNAFKKQIPKVLHKRPITKKLLCRRVAIRNSIDIHTKMLKFEDEVIQFRSMDPRRIHSLDEATVKQERCV
jgi:hypothetical protein